MSQKESLTGAARFTLCPTYPTLSNLYIQSIQYRSTWVLYDLDLAWSHKHTYRAIQPPNLTVWSIHPIIRRIPTHQSRNTKRRWCLTGRRQLALPLSPSSLRLRMQRGSIASTFATCSLFHFVSGGVRLHAQLIKRYTRDWMRLIKCKLESCIQMCKTRSRALWVMNCHVVRLISLNVMLGQIVNPQTHSWGVLQVEPVWGGSLCSLSPSVLSVILTFQNSKTRWSSSRKSVPTSSLKHTSIFFYRFFSIL